MVADRIVLLDHLTRGRVNFGVGPGGHLTDARDAGPGARAPARRCMAEALEVIVRLLSDDRSRSRCASDWFQLRDAVLQLRPLPAARTRRSQRPAWNRRLGHGSWRDGYGAGVPVAGRSRGAHAGPIDLAAQLAAWPRRPAAAGRTVDRSAELAPRRARSTWPRPGIRRSRTCAPGPARFLLDYVEGTTGRPRPVAGPPDAGGRPDGGAGCAG